MYYIIIIISNIIIIIIIIIIILIIIIIIIIILYKMHYEHSQYIKCMTCNHQPTGGLNAVLRSPASWRIHFVWCLEVHGHPGSTRSQQRRTWVLSGHFKGTMMGKWWNNGGIMMGKWKMMGKRWENDGTIMGNGGKR